jgi:hypothetical protein
MCKNKASSFSSSYIKVYTPIGTSVDIVIQPPGTYDGFMNVDIWMAPKDTESSEGLCGFMDGDMRNDLKTRTGNVIPLDNLKISSYKRRPSRFTNSWR